MQSVITGLVVVTGERAGSRLRQIARLNDLSILEVSNARQAVRTIARLRPRVVVVQVSRRLKESVRLIRLIATANVPTRLIAIARSHDDRIERAIRCAGVTCYCPGDSLSLIDEVLATVLPPAT